MSKYLPLFAVLIAACAQAQSPERGSAPPGLTKAEGIPGDSLITVAAALRSDALRNLAAFSQAEYGCPEPKLVNTKNEKVDGQLALDGAGRLHSGHITERWQIDACGASKTLKVLFGPDGKGGNFVAIGEINE